MAVRASQFKTHYRCVICKPDSDGAVCDGAITGVNGVQEQLCESPQVGV